MGFSSSISMPISYAQSGRIADLPFLDFNSDNNNKENNNLEELYDMVVNLVNNLGNISLSMPFPLSLMDITTHF